MPDVLTLLDAVGAWSLPRLWLPIALWTGVAGLVWLSLYTRRLVHPHARYAMAFALLLALPLSLAAGPVLNSILPVPLAPVGVMNEAGPPIPDMGERTEAPVLVESAIQRSHTPSARTVPLLTLNRLAGLAVVLILLIALHGLLRLAWTAWSLHRFRQRLTPSPVLQTAVDAHRATWKVRRSIQAAVSPVSTTPFTFGWLRPVIVVPDLLHGTALDLAITHELAHLRRHDFAVRFIEAVLVALFGWHPLVQALSQRLGTDRERLCDTEVLAHHPTQRRAYADLLLSLASAPAPILALGMTPHSSHLTERIEAMNTPPLSHARLAQFRWTARLLSLALFALAVSLAGLGTAAALPNTLPFTERTGEPLVIEASDSTPEAIPLDLDPPRSAGVTEEEAPTLPEQSAEVRRDTIVYEVVEDMPEPIGGLAALQAEVRYPQLARRAGIEGRVYVQFIVDEEGRVQNAQVVRGVGSGLDEEALRIVQQARFRPGRQSGEVVKVRMNLPITFQLNENSYAGTVRPAQDLIARYQARQEQNPTDEQLADLEAAIRAELTAAQADADALLGNSGAEPTPSQRADMVRLQTRIDLLEHRYRQIIEQQERQRLRQMEDEIMGRDG